MFEALKDYLWVHPWAHATLVVLPPLVIAVIALWRENHHWHVANQLKAENNRLESEANKFRAEANGLRDQLNKAVARIAHNTAKIPTEGRRTPKSYAIGWDSTRVSLKDKATGARTVRRLSMLATTSLHCSFPLEVRRLPHGQPWCSATSCIWSNPRRVWCKLE
jgi:hypothetical protein